MNKKFLDFYEKLKKPPLWVKIVTFVSTVLFVAGAFIVIATTKETSLPVLAYVLFALSALTFAYSVFLIVLTLPSAKKNIVAFLERHEFTHRLLRNFGFRTLFLAIFSFAMSIVFACFNGYMGIKNLSIWYGALATYYIALALLRGGILLHHKKKKGDSDEVTKIKVYRNSGIVLLLLNVALSSAIAQMIFSGEHFSYVGLTIFAYAAYAFYKITMSIINLVRAKKQTDLTIQAVRNVNLADATVSILALQTALLTTFGGNEINFSLMNTLTGCAVSFFTIGLAIFMIITATKKIKSITKEKDNEQQI